MKRANLLMCLGIFFAVQNLFGQIGGTPTNNDPNHPLPPWVRTVTEKRERMNETVGLDRNGMIANRDRSAVPKPLYSGRESEIKELEKAYSRTKAMLVVPHHYFEKYKVLLKNNQTHLIRLQPDRNCYSELVVSAEELEKCSDVVPIPGGGSLYSFRSKLNYPLTGYTIRADSTTVLNKDRPTLNFDRGGNWWNIHFADNAFAVENTSFLGIISEIGDVDFEDLDLNRKEFEFLKNFKIKDSLPEIKQQNETLKKGINFNNYNYSTSTPVKPNSTYVLRTINFWSKTDAAAALRAFRAKLKLRTPDNDDKLDDMIIALKVVGQESDGSVIVLWRAFKTEQQKKK